MPQQQRFLALPAGRCDLLHQGVGQFQVGDGEFVGVGVEPVLEKGIADRDLAALIDLASIPQAAQVVKISAGVISAQPQGLGQGVTLARAVLMQEQNHLPLGGREVHEFEREQGIQHRVAHEIGFDRHAQAIVVLKQVVAKPLHQVGMVVRVELDRRHHLIADGNRPFRLSLANEGRAFECRQTRKIMRREDVQKGGCRPFLAAVMQMGQGFCGCQDHTQVGGALEGRAQTAGDQGVSLHDGHQRLGFVDQQQNPAIVLGRDPRDRAQQLADVCALQGADHVIQLGEQFALIFDSVKQLLAQIKLRLASLHIPVDGNVLGLGLQRQLAQQRGLAHPPRADHPNIVIRAAEQVAAQSCIAVIMAAHDPAAHDIRITDGCDRGGGLGAQ